MYLRLHFFVNGLDKLLSMIDGLVHVRTDMRALENGTSERGLLLELFLHLLVRLEIRVQSRQPGRNLAMVLYKSISFVHWIGWNVSTYRWNLGGNGSLKFLQILLVDGQTRQRRQNFLKFASILNDNIFDRLFRTSSLVCRSGSLRHKLDANISAVQS